MAEENTEQTIDDDDESQAGASSDSENESGAQGENDTQTEAASADVETEDPDSSEQDAEEKDQNSDDVPQPANDSNIGNEIPVVEPTRVSAADGSEITSPIADISMLLDIPVTLSMEIGQTKISINELLKLGKDSVIELQRMAHEPLDVLVNGTLVAHGEAVVVGERFGIRLTDVISPQERLRKFGE